jgi:hypothetical protein
MFLDVLEIDSGAKTSVLKPWGVRQSPPICGDLRFFKGICSPSVRKMIFSPTDSFENRLQLASLVRSTLKDFQSALTT